MNRFLAYLMLICVMVALVAADNDFGYKRSNAMRPEEFLNLGVSTSTSIPNIFPFQI
jgi:hypothetical protein